MIRHDMPAARPCVKRGEDAATDYPLGRFYEGRQTRRIDSEFAAAPETFSVALRAGVTYQYVAPASACLGCRKNRPDAGSTTFLCQRLAMR